MKDNKLYVLNFKQTNVGKIKKIKCEDIPDRLPKAVSDVLFNGDSNPVMKVEAIRYPCKGDMGNYTKEFFESFLKVTDSRPIPGTKRGHTYQSRNKSDFYTVSGMCVDDEGPIQNKNGLKEGTAYFKIYAPKMGDETSNEGFIRDLQMNMVHFSLVSYADYKFTRNKETDRDEIFFTKSTGGERNDAMEYNEGAMEQVVNSDSLIDFDLDEVTALIDAGNVTKESNAEHKVIWNGNVSRSSLRHLVSRANGKDRVILGDLIARIDNSGKGEKRMEKEELFAALRLLVTNKTTTPAEVLTAIGVTTPLRSEEDEKNAALVKTFNTKLGEKPEEKLEKILEENRKAAEHEALIAVDALVINKKITMADGTEKDSPAYIHAKRWVENKHGDALQTALEELKKDEVFKTLNKKAADGGSSVYVSDGDTPSPVEKIVDGVKTYVFNKKE